MTLSQSRTLRGLVPSAAIAGAPAAAHRNRWDGAIIGGLALIALVSRGYGLGDTGLIFDEYYTVQHAADRFASLVNPAYYLLVVGSMAVFGETEWAARLPAMILGALGIPLFFLSWRGIIGRNAALIGAILIVFSSWHLWFSQFSRFYSGVFLFGLLSYALYYHALLRNDLRLLAGAFATALLAVLFHATAVMVPVTCGLFSLIVLMPGPRPATPYSRRIARIYLIVCASLGAVSAGLFLDIAHTWVGLGEQQAPPTPAELVLQMIRDIELPIGVAAVFGTLYLLQREPLKGLFLGIGFGVPAAAMLAGSFVVEIKPHYMFYSFPLMIAAAAVLCEVVRRRLSHTWLAGYVVLALVIAGVLPRLASHYSERYSPDIRQVIEVVAEAYRPGDRVVPLMKGFEYYRPGDMNLAVAMPWPYRDDVAWARIMDGFLRDSERLWIVLPVTRRLLADELETWLRANGRLYWRAYTRRFDYVMNGFEIFLVTRDGCPQCQSAEVVP